MKTPPMLCLMGLSQVYQLAIIAADRADTANNGLRPELASRYAATAIKHIETMEADLAKAKAQLKEMLLPAPDPAPADAKAVPQSQAA